MGIKEKKKMGDGGWGDRKGHHTGASNREYSHYSKKEDSDKRTPDEDCFVASAVYGNANAHEVEVLREYRDNVLMQGVVGRRFVNFYYSGAGKKTAEFIKEKGKFLIPAIRKGLDYIVGNYEMKRGLNSEDRKE